MTIPSSAHSRSTSIEILESRVAPSGLVTVEYTVATGVLSLTGDDSSNSIRIVSTGPGTHRIEGLSTDLSTGGTVLDIGKLTSISFAGGAGFDDLSLFSVAINSLSFDGGLDSDTFFATNLAVKGNVSLSGSAGEFATFSGTSTTIGGNVTMTAGDDMAVAFGAQNTKIGGSILATAGTATFSLGANGAGPLTIGKGIRVQGGSGDTQLSLFPLGPMTIGKLPAGESIVVEGGSFIDSVELRSAGMTLAGGVRMTGGTSFKELTIGAEQHNVKIGRSPTGHSILVDNLAEGELSLRALNLTAAGGIEFTVGSGTNEFRILTPNGKTAIGKLATGQSILFTGGTGNDRLLVDTGTFMLAGGIEFEAGSGDNLLSLAGNAGIAKIGKFGTGTSVLFNGGSGNDQANFTLPNTTLAGGIQFSGGSGVNSLFIETTNGRLTAGKQANGASIQYSGGASLDSMVINGGSVKLLGGIDFNGGDGANFIEIGEISGSLTAGKLASGASLRIVGGAADDSFEFVGAAINFAGGIDFDGGTGENDFALALVGSAKVGSLPTGQSIRFSGGADGDEIYLNGTSVSLKGSIELTGGSGSDRITLQGPATTIGKSPAGDSILFNGGADNDTINLEDIVSLAGGITFFGGDGQDSLFAHELGTLNARGSILFEGGLDRDRLEIQSSLIQIGGGLTFDGGDDRDRVILTANGSINGNVRLDLGTNTSGTSDVVMASNGRAKGLTLRGGLEVRSSGLMPDALTIIDLTILKNFSASMSDGSSVVTLDNLFVSGSFTVNAGEGGNEIAFERQNFFGPSVIGKLATIISGGGSDLILIGNPETSAVGAFPDPTRVRFLGGLTLNAGDGTDQRNDISGQNDILGPGVTGLDTFEDVVP